jgi:hypothetical protein
MSQRSQLGEHPIDRLRSLPLEPIDYCRRWVLIDPARSYWKVCVNALAQATGLSPKTIKNWGTNFQQRPRYIPYVLRQADLLNQIRELDRAQQLSTLLLNTLHE